MTTTIAPSSNDSNCQDKGDLCDSQPPFGGLCDDGIYYNWIEEYNGEYFSNVCPAVVQNSMKNSRVRNGHSIMLPAIKRFLIEANLSTMCGLIEV